MLRNRPKIAKLVCMVGFLDLLAVSMIVPLISTRIKSLGGSPVLIGFVGSIYGAVQLFSSPCIGSWSDVKGRKQVLLMSLIAAGFGYLLMGVSDVIAVLVMARFVLGK